MSLLDNDLYKFTMQQTALHLFPSTEVEYKLIVRTKGVDLRPLIPKLESRLETLCAQKFEQDELDYLRGIRFLKPDYVNFLEDFRLKSRFVRIGEKDGQLDIRIKGDWVSTVPFEVPLLALISETFHDGNSDESEGAARLKAKIEFARKSGLRFIDFGTRRRYSHAWHSYVVSNLKTLPSDVFAGTSNLYFAKKFGLKPTGTMAHEYLQAGQGLGNVQLAKSQKYMLEKWAEEYRGDLGIALTDTIGMKAFLNDFDLYLAKLYDGCRQDSGDPIAWGEAIIAHYQKLGIDPRTKVAVFSDNLTLPRAHEINEHFRNRIMCTFGIGTNLTNDLGTKPLSIVIKLVRVNGNPVAKISDEAGKEICEDRQFLNYLKKVYHLPYGLYRSMEEYLAAEGEAEMTV